MSHPLCPLVYHDVWWVNPSAPWFIMTFDESRSNTKRFKRMLIYFNTGTQYENFRGNHLYQATKRHLNNKYFNTDKQYANFRFLFGESGWLTKQKSEICILSCLGLSRRLMSQPLFSFVYREVWSPLFLSSSFPSFHHGVRWVIPSFPLFIMTFDESAPLFIGLSWRLSQPLCPFVYRGVWCLLWPLVSQSLSPFVCHVW